MRREKKVALMLKELVEVFAKIENKQEMECFLQGLLTPSEIEEIQGRWLLLCALLEGNTQRKISEELGISLGKITRGSRLLKYGDENFINIVKRIYEEKN